MICAGVFERLPELRIILGDVSVHMARALIVRTDKDWQSDRIEVPWVTKEPSLYFEKHVRFVTQPEDETIPHSARVTDTIGGDNPSLVVFGSRDPYWDGVKPDDAFKTWSQADRAKCLSGNATQFYPRLAERFAAN
jgi:predicted TIM-barrel fold metal-dependent hydrolase